MLVQMSKTASTKYIARSDSFRREPIAESNGVELPSSQMTCWAHGAELSIHLHEVSERIGLHLLHYFTSMSLNRDLADAKLAPNLFVQQTGDDQRHYLSFARG